MMQVEGKVDVRCRIEDAWDLFCRFGDVAALIPSVEEVEVDGDRVDARVATKLGALTVSSRVALEVLERKPFACLKARGVSYLGETLKTQVKEGIRGIDRDSVGELFLHLDLRPGEDTERVWVVYTAEVEAKGRLKRIYQTILKTKVPTMMEEFAANIRGALENGTSAAGAEACVSEPAESPPRPEPSGAGPGETDAPEPPADAPAVQAKPEPASVALLAPRPGLLARIIAWLRGLLGRMGLAS